MGQNKGAVDVHMTPANESADKKVAPGKDGGTGAADASKNVTKLKDPN
jgi:hypothetical protein